MVDVQTAQHREVVVFSDADPKAGHWEPFEDGGHRNQSSERKKKDHSIHDPKGGVNYCSYYSPSMPKGPHSPRHRHNFDQIRIVLRGEVEYGGKRFGPGWIGYFPEGVYYGPQWRAQGSSHIALQFPGLSEARFKSHADTLRGTRLVREAGGRFEDGICIWPDGRKQDGAEAVMEAVFGPFGFPPARYSEQIWMNTENYPWQETSISGVSVKPLAYFHLRGPAIQMIGLEPGASTPAGRTGAFMIRYILEGEAEYAGQPCPAISCIYYPPDAPYQGLTSATGASVLSVELQAQLPGSAPPEPYRI